jgi:hypothetical protein
VVPVVIVIVTRAGAGGGGVARLVRTEVRMDISLDVDWVGTGNSPELLVQTMWTEMMPAPSKGGGWLPPLSRG